MYLDQYLSEGYYDDYGNWVEPADFQVGLEIPEGHVHDADGRLMKHASEIIDYNVVPEEIGLFCSKWQVQKMSPEKDWRWTTKFIFPDINRIVKLKRFDIYQSISPRLQQGTTDIVQSRMIRRTEGWLPFRSIFFMDENVPMTADLFVETTGPPRRNKFRPTGREIMCFIYLHSEVKVQDSD